MTTIKFEGQEERMLTPNHPVLTTRGWVVVSELKTGDVVLTRKKTSEKIGTATVHKIGATPQVVESVDNG